ncbi:MAG: DUF1611 domain-containing protein [Saprospiraceae bacterium]|nr:DUF1611 domain-containing protein [Saprospiraceae bacterium]
MINTAKKLAIYMDGALDTDYGKMGIGVMCFSANPITCVIDSKHQGKTVREAIGQPFDYPIVGSINQAHQMGSEVLVLGIAPSGGKFPDSWNKPISESLILGMSLINGLHDDLNARFGHLIDQSKEDQVIWDVRKPAKNYPIASAKAGALGNLRVLLVGTDMAVGKMTTGIELYRWFRERHYSTEFLATGQIGITVMGKGIPLDAIKVDQACGAVEDLVLSAADKDFVFVEGQGSLLHPGSTATLPLMRGSCANRLILCHRAEMKNLFDQPKVKIPPLKEFIALNEAVSSSCGSLTPAKCIGIALNTFKLTREDALKKIKETEDQTGLPVTDVVRFGPEKLAMALIKSR